MPAPRFPRRSPGSPAPFVLLVLAACGGRVGYTGWSSGTTTASGGGSGLSSGSTVGAAGSASGAGVAVTGVDVAGTLSGSAPSGSVTSGTSASPTSGATSGIDTSSGTVAGSGKTTVTSASDAGPEGGGGIVAVPSAGCGKAWTGATGIWVAQPTGCSSGCAGPGCPPGSFNQQGTAACQVIPPGGVVPVKATSGSPEYRGWWVYVPPGYDATKPYTVIYNGAGCFDANWFHAGADGFPYPKIDGDQAILVGLDYDTYSGLLGCYDTSASSNDLQFFPWLQARIESDFCVDTKSEFFSGYAVGAALAQQLNCAFPDKLRATVTVAGWEPGCPNGGEVRGDSLTTCVSKPTAALYVHDINDVDNSYACILQSCSRLLRQNGCTNTKCSPQDKTLTTPYSAPPSVALPKAGASCVAFNGCPADYPVVFCTTTNQGHNDGQSWGAPFLFWDFMSRLTSAPCPAGQVHQNGACAPCPAGKVPCGASCVDEQTDTNNCGACGRVCLGPFGTCQGGTCACAGGLSPCGNACVDEQGDPSHCGGCGVTCNLGASCVSGVCGPCPTGQTACKGTCVDEQSDPFNCGACGRACVTACLAGVCH